MLLFLSLVLMGSVIKTEGLTVTSVSSSPIVNGTTQTLKFCNYNLSSGESVAAIEWKFAARGSNSYISIGSFIPSFGFEAIGPYIGRLSRPDSSSGFVLLNGMTLDDSGNYSCEITTNIRQGSSSITETVIVHPTGPLYMNPCPGLENKTFNCCLAAQGVPPVTITLNHSNGGSRASSTSLCVDLYVTQPGNISCFVMLSDFPSYDLNVDPKTCEVNDKPTIRIDGLKEKCSNEAAVSFNLVAEGNPLPNIAVSGESTTLNELSSTETGKEVSLIVSPERNPKRVLVVVTAINSIGNESVTLFAIFEEPVCINDRTFAIILGCFLIALLISAALFFTPWLQKDAFLGLQIRDIVAIFTGVCVLVFVIIVIAVNLATCSECNKVAEIHLHNGSIALVVCGFGGMVAKGILLSCSIKKRRSKLPNPEMPCPEMAVLQEPKLNHVYYCGTFAMVHFSWLDVQNDHGDRKKFCAHWPPKNQEELAKIGAKKSADWKSKLVKILGSTGDIVFVFMKGDTTRHQESITSKVESRNLRSVDPREIRLPQPLQKFVAVELLNEKKDAVVLSTWLRQMKVDGLIQNRVYAYWPPSDQEAKVKEGAIPSENWCLLPVAIVGSADVFPGDETNSPNSGGADGYGKSSSGGALLKSHDGNNSQDSSAPPIRLTTIHSKGEENSDPVPSPNRRLPPLETSSDAGNEQPDSERKRKKKKNKKDQTESEKPRRLPIPNQVAPENQRRPSMDAHVNMSGSNTSSLPMMHAFTPGQPAS